MLIKWQTIRGHSFDEVESSHFHEMIEYVRQDSVVLPTGPTMKRRMMDLSARGIQDTRDMIKVILLIISVFCRF